MTCFDERLANEVVHFFQRGENPRATLKSDIPPCYYVLRYAIAYLNVSFRKLQFQMIRMGDGSKIRKRRLF